MPSLNFHHFLYRNLLNEYIEERTAFAEVKQDFSWKHFQSFIVWVVKKANVVKGSALNNRNSFEFIEKFASPK